MNIFYLDRDIEEAVKAHCDKHVVKMLLETAQLLCSAHHATKSPYQIPYKSTHINHPCAEWVRRSSANYLWLLNFGYALAAEYTHRYGRMHNSELVIEWADVYRPELSNIEFTPPPQCMPTDFKQEDTVAAYRDYYRSKDIKKTYTNREEPTWLT